MTTFSLRGTQTLYSPRVKNGQRCGRLRKSGRQTAGTSAATARAGSTTRAEPVLDAVQNATITAAASDDERRQPEVGALLSVVGWEVSRDARQARARERKDVRRHDDVEEVGAEPRGFVDRLRTEPR